MNNDVAHISFDGGGLILPVKTPYERELLVEHVEASTKRHGRVRLEVGRDQWVISRQSGAREVCAVCSQWPENLSYPTGSTGRLSVIRTGAALCTDGTCQLAGVGTEA